MGYQKKLWIVWYRIDKGPWRRWGIFSIRRDAFNARAKLRRDRYTKAVMEEFRELIGPLPSRPGPRTS